MGDMVTLKYKQQYYDDLIVKLQNYYEKLNKHADNLDKYRQQIPQFWKGKAAAAYEKVIYEQIQRVKSTQSQLDEFIQTMTDALDTSKRQSQAIKSTADEMLQAVDMLKIMIAK